MRFRCRATTSIVAIALATVALAACGGGRSAIPAASKSHEVPQLNVGWPAQMSTLDPDLAEDFEDDSALHLIGGNLLDKLPNGSIVPGLAISKAVSPDQLAWTFKLRPGLRFSNRERVTSNDVKATIERSMHNKANAWAGYFADIRAVDAPSPDTVVIRLSRPYPDLSTVLTEPEFAIFPASGLAKGESFFKAPVSAGPYKLTSWGGGLTATFARNPLYYGPKHLAATVVFKTIPDFNARISELQSGQIDFAGNLPPSLLPQLSSMNGITVSTPSLHGFISVLMNDSNPSLADLRVRKAISMAIDRQQINKVVWSGKLTPLAGFWPSTMTGYDPSISVSQDVAGAKQLLRGTRCQTGCSLKLIYETADAFMAPTALIISQDLQSIGINVRLDSMDISTWYQQISSGKMELSIANVYGYNNVPLEMALQGLLKSGGLNSLFSGYSSSQMNALVASADESQGAQRNAALAEINRLFVKNLPYPTLSTYAVVNASRLPSSVVSLTGTSYLQIGSLGS